MLKKPVYLIAATLLWVLPATARLPSAIFSLYNQITITAENAEPFRVAKDSVFAEKNVTFEEIPGNPEGTTEADRSPTLLAVSGPLRSPNGMLTATQRAWLGSLKNRHLRLTVEVRSLSGEDLPLTRIDYLKDAVIPDAEVRMVEGRPVICSKGSDTWYLYVEDAEVAIRETPRPDGSVTYSAWKTNPATIKPNQNVVFALRAGSGQPKLQPVMREGEKAR